MGNTLDSPITEKEGEYYRSSTGIEIGATGMQGWRLEMEDAHIAQDIPTKPDHTIVGIFDGHAGAGAAKYAAEHMLKFLLATEEWKKYVEGNCTDVTMLGEALIYTFINLDEKMRGHQDSTSGLDTSGCTSVVALITPKFILCANAGDSRCVLGTGGSTRPMSEDHKPHSIEEKRRIESAGGFVQWNRVDGDLAVSRALGDFTYKHRPDLHPKEQKISCYPDIQVHERTNDDDVLILACDGLWDVMTSEEAVNTVREIYLSGEKEVLKIAEEMVDLALDKGSKDNISTIIVKLPGAKIGPESNGGVDGRRKQRGVQFDARTGSPISGERSKTSEK